MEGACVWPFASVSGKKHNPVITLCRRSPMVVVICGLWDRAWMIRARWLYSRVAPSRVLLFLPYLSLCVFRVEVTVRMCKRLLQERTAKSCKCVTVSKSVRLYQGFKLKMQKAPNCLYCPPFSLCSAHQYDGRAGSSTCRCVWVELCCVIVPCFCGRRQQTGKVVVDKRISRGLT